MPGICRADSSEWAMLFDLLSPLDAAPPAKRRMLFQRCLKSLAWRAARLSDPQARQLPANPRHIGGVPCGTERWASHNSDSYRADEGNRAEFPAIRPRRIAFPVRCAQHKAVQEIGWRCCLDLPICCGQSPVWCDVQGIAVSDFDDV